MEPVVAIFRYDSLTVALEAMLLKQIRADSIKHQNYSLCFDHKWKILNLGMDGAYIFTKYSYEEGLYRAKKDNVG